MRLLKFLGLLIVLFSSITLRIGEIFLVFLPKKATKFISQNPKKTLGGKPVGVGSILKYWAKLIYWLIGKGSTAFNKGKEVLGRYPRQYYPRFYDLLSDILW